MLQSWTAQRGKLERYPSAFFFLSFRYDRGYFSFHGSQVCGVKSVKNPVKLARAVMEKSGHVMLSGSGAEDFARVQKLDLVNNTYFTIKRRSVQMGIFVRYFSFLLSLRLLIRLSVLNAFLGGCCCSESSS